MKTRTGAESILQTPTYYLLKLAATAKSLQSCPTLCDLIDGSPPGSPIPGILQARVLEWGAIAFSTKVWYTLMNGHWVMNKY